MGFTVRSRTNRSSSEPGICPTFAPSALNYFSIRSFYMADISYAAFSRH
jgi:hypothetical protein